MSLSDNNDDDLLVFEEEYDVSDSEIAESSKWKVLIVDDDEQIHLVTKLALSDIKILNRELQFFHAYNSSDAFSILKDNRDTTVVLMDVVMETDSAGLDLVRKIRDQLQRHSLRIIIRTGQPGYAPELKVIEEYDINDYKMKSELTRNRLISTLTTTIRSYKQYKTLAQHKRGMEQMIDGSKNLFSFDTIEHYSYHVINQVNQILNTECNALVCNQHLSINNENSQGEFFIIATSLYYRDYLDKTIDKIDQKLRKNIKMLFKNEMTFFEDNFAFIYLPNDNVHKGALVIHTNHFLDESEQQLLKVFAVQVSVGFGNQYLLHKLHQFAYFDQLCQLPNRTKFLAEIKLRQLKETDLTVALVDVDQFSEINNAMGYQNGDLLLQSISLRLIENLPSDNFIARISGDTFGILGSRADIDAIALIALFKKPYIINGTSFPIKATVGLANLDPPDINNEEVLKNADMAMKIAKNTPGTKFKYFNRDMDKATQNRIQITRDLRMAIERDELVLHFQPQLNLESGKLVGVESLIRWQKPYGELVPPSKFIPIAEQSGLIIDIGEIALKKSLEFLKNWIASGKEPFRVGVNVSVRQFHSDNFSDFLVKVLKDSSITAKYLELEITESILMQDVEHVIKILNHAKKLGMSIAIDDFGTGFSSLSYLLKLPIDRLKIDRSFIKNLETDQKAQRLTQLIIRMGKQLKLDLIAEGVETREQALFLKDLECDEVQGFLYSKPLSASDFSDWVELYRNNLNKSKISG
ncbi:MAG: EAL domain-containing protein [Spirochaetaceae bacterium]|nr:EAL domain-containing protein [Spirochaetaceae bacterium]